MTNPILRFLKATRVVSTSDAEKQATLDALNLVLGTGLDAEAMFEEIHQRILHMFEDYSLFGDHMRNILSLIEARKWSIVAQHIEQFIIQNKYPKDSGETPIRRGLIQIYLHFFASRYLNRPQYSFKFIRTNYLNLKNLNRLQSDRELVFTEILERIKSESKRIQAEETAKVIIPRAKAVRSLIDQLTETPFQLLVAPQGMGKSIFLELIANQLRNGRKVYTYQFSLQDQISHPDYFFGKMLSLFSVKTFPKNKSSHALYLFDDFHLLPPSLQQVFRIRILPEVQKIQQGQDTQIAIVIASAFPLESLIEYHPDSPRFATYHLTAFDPPEVQALYDKAEIKSPYSPQEIYEATRGYPALVSQMVTSGVTFDNSLWFNTIFSSINWDEPITALMKALCTFRYIGPFFMNDLAKFISDPYLMQEVWHIPETISDHTQARLLWEKLINKNAFIHRVSLDQQEFPLDKNFKIDRVLRQLAENAVCADQPALFDQRHKIAADYYYAQIINPLIPGHKKPLLIIEYFYHLVKQGISDIQILQIAEQLQSLARSKETLADVELSNALFRKHFCYDQELKEIMNEDLFNSIIAVTHKEGAA